MPRARASTLGVGERAEGAGHFRLIGNGRPVTVRGDRPLQKVADGQRHIHGHPRVEASVSFKLAVMS